ncbi:MAG: hypothetical protein OHK93_008468 [Ramalina farinacea]|uniref:Uncharacterized protein n=1 Tax=Ramalina farinacea TaxID=258253 RepID=A0AA43QMH4_9LECA|nr:hypothetical protein [Ramalina farinacea]
MRQKCFRIEDKVLIFLHRQPIISYVAARLREEDSVHQRFATELEVVVIEGQVHPEKRQEIAEAFNESEKFQIDVISTLAGPISSSVFVVEHRNIKPGVTIAKCHTARRHRPDSTQSAQCESLVNSKENLGMSAGVQVATQTTAQRPKDRTKVVRDQRPSDHAATLGTRTVFTHPSRCLPRRRRGRIRMAARSQPNVWYSCDVDMVAPNQPPRIPSICSPLHRFTSSPINTMGADKASAHRYSNSYPGVQSSYGTRTSATLVNTPTSGLPPSGPKE